VEDAAEVPHELLTVTLTFPPVGPLTAIIESTLLLPVHPGGKVQL
jgi:hypothetical protein